MVISLDGGARSSPSKDCRLHDLVVKIVARSEPCRRFMAIPGVGPVTALSFMTAIDDPSRFRRSRDVAAYFGLTSRRWQSGSSIDVQGRISKAGDADVRRALYEAASGLMTRFKGKDKVKSWGQEIAKRSCHRKACVAVARKLAVIMHAIYGPAARCKGIRNGVANFGMRQSIRPRMGACAPGHHGNPHTHACIQVSGEPGRPLCHPFQVTSQTVAGTSTLRVSHASRRRLRVRLGSPANERAW